MSNTWSAWTFRIGSKAFKNIRPIAMEIVPEKAILKISGILWWRKVHKTHTGKWLIILKYDRGPSTIARTDKIFFDSEGEARWWFNETYHSVFAEIQKPIPPKSKKTQPKKPHLRLL